MKTKARSGFADRAAFDHAVNTTRDGQIVLIDGVTVRGGVEPGLRFVTAEDGRIVLEELETADA